MSNIDSCPMCGTPVHVVGAGEGTQHYEPVRPLLRGTPEDRERLAIAEYEKEYLVPRTRPWSEVREVVKREYRRKADAIIAVLRERR